MLHKNKSARRAFSLLEVILALTILSIVSTAVATMLAGAGEAHQYVNKETEAMSQVETAYRRILHNLRTAQALTTPSDGTLHTPGTITLTTQNDSANGYASGATVTYSVSNGNLVETDQRYGTNTIVPNISVFSVQRIATSPTRISVTITSGTTPAVTRSAIITCRNF